MAMQTSPQISWWNAFGSQPLPPVSLAGDSDSFGSAVETEHGVDKQNNSATHLAFSLGDVKSSRVVAKPHGAAFSMQPPCLELGFTQQQMYPCVEQGYYGVVSAYGSQSRVMLPLNMETEDGTIFVNSKQYHAIIRRRQSRAKAAAKADGTKQTQSQAMSQQSNSQNSEVLHPESGTMNLSTGLNVSGSEVTSMNYFLSSPVHPLGGMVMPSKWTASVAAMDNGCCYFKT
ncbi:hypothetical protein IGI04_004003 [Brassica rapa subsp. trilocularis]|uniref:Nuclear transcription factor Y subunit n=1 Tax=Brassica rapa subsp. trilocularis TaxID=1813537 RepID=A0ABQ7P234_BRACM|nr:hypothetical protein IGI04_004003 [Brassica rapa subsp. trilocularis]